MTRTMASSSDVEHIVELVCSIRIHWEPHLVRAILQAHRHQVELADLAVAAVRAANNPELHTPKTIGWRGPHWDQAKTKPAEVQLRRCGVCGKREDRCATERIGIDDDHQFEPVLSDRRVRV